MTKTLRAAPSGIPSLSPQVPMITGKQGKAGGVIGQWHEGAFTMSGVSYRGIHRFFRRGAQYPSGNQKVVCNFVGDGNSYSGCDNVIGVYNRNNITTQGAATKK